MALDEQTFKAQYRQALQRWAKKEMASPQGAHGTAQKILNNHSESGGEGFTNQAVNQGWKTYAADPDSYYQRVSEGTLGTGPQAALPFWDLDLSPEGQAAAATEKDQKSGLDIMRAFAAKMMEPLNVNDPYVAQVIKGASTQASDSARMRGLGGSGYATSNIQAAALRAGNEVQMQRNQLGLNAMQGAESIGLQQAQLAQQAYDRQYQAQLTQMQQQAQQRQGTGQTIGSIAGGIIGSLPGVFTLNPALAVGGASVGAGIGGGIGGAAAGGGSAPYMPYKGPGGKTSTSSGSRGNY